MMCCFLNVNFQGQRVNVHQITHTLAYCSLLLTPRNKSHE